MANPPVPRRGRACRVARRRAVHLFVVLLACYLSLDFADQGIPGALNFDLNKILAFTEAPVQQDDTRHHPILTQGASMASPSDKAATMRRQSSLPHEVALPQWLGKLRQSHSPGIATPAASEDD
jgi:hypothetical protein